MLPYSLNKQGIASLATLISTFVLLAGVIAGSILVRQKQEIREKAVIPAPCYICQNDLCKKVADPPYCDTGDNECSVKEDCIIPTACIPDGKCLDLDASCCNGNDYFDPTCPVTETRCGTKPTPYCSDYMYDQCLYGCEPTSGGGKCKLPPTPYCSTNNLLRCDYGCEPDSYGGRCKSQSTPAPAPYCSRYLYDQCLYGCEPTSDGGKCKPTECENLKTVGQCDAQSCAWYYCSNKCQPQGTSYVGADCAEPCPPLPGATGVNEECGFIGQTCENQNSYSTFGLYVCQEGTWQEHGELKIFFDNSCSEEEKNKYRDLIGLAPLELHTNETIEISCPDEGGKFTVIIDYEEIESTSCGSIGGNNMTLSCNDPVCQPRGYYTCQYIVNHELAHHQAGATNLSSHEIESFNTAIGCRSNGKGDFSFEENPVTGYGRSNCAEAYAELIAQYIHNPCDMEYNPDLSSQYEWLSTNPDSPFQGKELCK